MAQSEGRFTRLLAAGAIALAVVGCDEGRDSGTVTARADVEQQSAPESYAASVRVVNAIPGGPVTVWAGDSVVFRRVRYRQATAYREIPDELFDFQIKRSPLATPLAQSRENLQYGARFTLVALPSAGGTDKRNLRVLEDDPKAPNPDKARVRFINAVPGDVEVDVQLLGRSEVLFDAVDFEEEAGWKGVDPMVGTLEVRPAGGRDVLVSLPDVRLEGGESYTFVLSGGPGQYGLIRIEDAVEREGSAGAG